MSDKLTRPLFGDRERLLLDPHATWAHACAPQPLTSWSESDNTVQRFYAERTAAHSGVSRHHAKTRAGTVVQRTSSDLRLNAHLHEVFLDGAYHEQDA